MKNDLVLDEIPNEAHRITSSGSSARHLIECDGNSSWHQVFCGKQSREHQKTIGVVSKTISVYRLQHEVRNRSSVDRDECRGSGLAGLQKPLPLNEERAKRCQELRRDECKPTHRG